MIITGNDYFRMTWEAYKLTEIVPKMGRQGLGQFGVDLTYELKAYINHGRWCVRCECGGSEYAWEEGFFMCQSCFNATHGHQYGIVEFPPERKFLEKLLEMRPKPNRNWFIYETVTDLMAENEEHRAELLEVG